MNTKLEGPQVAEL